MPKLVLTTRMMSNSGNTITVASGAKKLLHSMLMPNNAASSQLYMRVFRGAKPTKAELDNISTFPYRASDQLLSFNVTVNAGSDVNADSADGSVEDDNYYGQNISASGTVTGQTDGLAVWWTLQTGSQVQGNTNSFFGLICGDVSEVGGAGELQLINDYVVTGRTYNLNDFILALSALNTYQ